MYIFREEPACRGSTNGGKRKKLSEESFLSGAGGSRTLVQLRKPGIFYMLSLAFFFRLGMVADKPAPNLIRDQIRLNVTNPQRLVLRFDASVFCPAEQREEETHAD